MNKEITETNKEFYEHSLKQINSMNEYIVIVISMSEDRLGILSKLPKEDVLKLLHEAEGNMIDNKFVFKKTF